MHTRCLRRDRRADASLTGYPKLAADPGRIIGSPDVALGELKLAIFDIPERFKTSHNANLFLAASTSSVGWRRQYLEIGHAGHTHRVQTPARKSILGYAERALKDDSVEVALCDSEQWLVSCGDEDLEQGDNLAVLGSEFVQFGEAISLGAGRFRLGRLRRGRLGTEHAIATHTKNEPFALIEAGTLQPISLAPSGLRLTY
jgi:hypothetical protein